MAIVKMMLALAGATFAAGGAQAQSASGPVKIGVMADMSSAYSDIGGKGLVEAARMAVQDFGGTVLGLPVELVYTDGQNKVDVASAAARRWFDQDGVDMVTDLPTSALALAISELGREKKKIVMVTSASTSELTAKACSPYTVHWTYDTYALANGTGAAVSAQGGKNWYFMTADYSFGYALQADASAVIEKNGGKVLGAVRSPLNTPDFSSYLLQAQSSKAGIIGLALGGNDVISAIKQAADFGIGRPGSQQKLVALLAFLSDVKSIGLSLGQGLLLTEAFYWDQNDATRAWSQRFQDRVGRKPTMTQAGTYGAVLHYLNAVKAAGTKDADAVMAKMRETPINDFMTRDGKLRLDGRVVRDMYLFEVKKPEESKGEWDLYKQVAVIPGDVAFRPQDKGGCPLVGQAAR
ncbi:MAG: ABC transporter substrate-binding protein [Achromobacter veterisilvae]